MTRRASRVAGESAVVAELAANPNAAADPTLITAGAHAASSSSPHRIDLSASSVGALASGLLARKLVEESKVDVPLGKHHQIAPPPYIGVWQPPEGEEARRQERLEGKRCRLGAIEADVARSTAARLTAAAYGVESELAKRFTPAHEDTIVYPLPAAAAGGAAYSSAAAAAAAPTGSAGPSHHAAALRAAAAPWGGAHGQEHACSYCGKVLCKAGALTMHIRFCKVRLGLEQPPQPAASVPPPPPPQQSQQEAQQEAQQQSQQQQQQQQRLPPPPDAGLTRPKAETEAADPLQSTMPAPSCEDRDASLRRLEAAAAAAEIVLRLAPPPPPLAPPSAPAEGAAEDQRTFACGTCGRTFGSSSGCVRHERFCDQKAPRPSPRRQRRSSSECRERARWRS